MAIRTLSRDELAFGRAVLLATDSLGMSAEGAFWIYDEVEQKWHYFLVTSLFNKVGPREIYLKLGQALEQKLSEQEIQDFVFFIADPAEGIVENIRNEISTTEHASEPKHIKIKLNGSANEAIVYRLTRGLSEDKARQARRRFNRMYSEVVAA